MWDMLSFWTLLEAAFLVSARQLGSSGRLLHLPALTVTLPSGVSQSVQVLHGAAKDAHSQLCVGLAAGAAVRGRRRSPGHWACLTDCWALGTCSTGCSCWFSSSQPLGWKLPWRSPGGTYSDESWTYHVFTRCLLLRASKPWKWC